MGASLARAAQWTAVSEVGKGKLELSPLNEKLLAEIINFVTTFPDKHIEESDYVFMEPLSWETSIRNADFGTGYDVIGSTVASDEKDSKGSSLLEVNNGVMKLRTLRQAANLLRVLKGKSTNETRRCLEANSDPVAKILGPAFATVTSEDSTVIRMVNRHKDGEDENSIQLRLLLIMQQLDMRLLNYCLNEMSKQVRLTPEVANVEVDLLRKFSGDEPSTPLKEIHFTSSHVFNNNCRALPWRQLHGDICYVSIKPHDDDRFCVTASTYGWFVNGGYDEDAHEVNYEKHGEVHKDLITLLRSKSSKFAENIDKQEMSRREEDESVAAGDDSGSVVDDEQEMEKETDAASEKYHSQTKQVNSKGKIKIQRKKKLEPSLKWKTIEESQKTEKSVPKKKVVPKSPGLYNRRKSIVRVKSAVEELESESSEESSDEEDTPAERRNEGTDLPSEYWAIQKLVKYLKGGNQTATIIALCSMRDFNLHQETCQIAIRDVGGLEVMINLLDTEDNRCKIGALQILKEITHNVLIRKAVADLGGLQTMVEILQTRNKELKALTAETIANVARFKKARKTVREHGGIKKLVALLKIPEKSKDLERDIAVARSGALALLSLSKSSKIKNAMKRAGAIPLLANLLKSIEHESLLIPVVGTLQECASDMSYRMAIRKEGMIPYLVKNLGSESAELQMHCASAIFKSAEDKITRNLVRQYQGLSPLIDLLKFTGNKPLLAAATGAIWKCAKSIENVEIFKELKAIETLVDLLEDQPEEVLVNVVGAIAECCKVEENLGMIRSSGGIPPMIKLLTGTNQMLLVNTTNAVGQCAKEMENMQIIDKLDGVRLLWSLLKNPNHDVQASAAWAVCPCIQNAKDSGEMVRSFVGGLELIVHLLKSDDIEVLASCCAAIAQIAKDEENLAVITDHGVVPLLGKLAHTTSDNLRHHLAAAIAQCCTWGNNRIAFGNEKAVAPVVGYLDSKDLDVHRATARALYQLSREPRNCVTMHESGVVKRLLKMVGSKDTVLQEAAAGCIGNIRRLAFINEKTRYG